MVKRHRPMNWLQDPSPSPGGGAESWTLATATQILSSIFVFLPNWFSWNLGGRYFSRLPCPTCGCLNTSISRAGRTSGRMERVSPQGQSARARALLLCWCWKSRARGNLLASLLHTFKYLILHFCNTHIMSGQVEVCFYFYFEIWNISFQDKLNSGRTLMTVDLECLEISVGKPGAVAVVHQYTDTEFILNSLGLCHNLKIEAWSSGPWKIVHSVTSGWTLLIVDWMANNVIWNVWQTWCCQNPELNSYY